MTTVFSVSVINQEELDRWKKSDIPVYFKSDLVAVDIDARLATFEQADGSRIVEIMVFLHVTPSMRAPDAIKNSPNMTTM